MPSPLSLLVFGRTGQVAVELQRLAGPDLIVETLDRRAADLTDPEACAELIARTEADAVINAAAHTAVDKAEDEPDLAHTVNATAPSAMAHAAAKRGLPFLHISTDYVFGGNQNRPLLEDDKAIPPNVYGRSKLAGEQAVAAAAGPHLILRTARVFASHGTNFLRTILRIAAERDRLTVVDDQIGGPTAAGDIARALVCVAHSFRDGRGQSGVYHYCGRPPVSWHGFATAIVAEAGLDTEVAPIPTSDRPAPAPRPADSTLDCGKIARDYGIAQPDWRDALATVLMELQSEKAVGVAQ